MNATTIFLLGHSMSFGLALIGTPLIGQVLSDPLDAVGDGTYIGGFGEFNWVNAADFGFANHAGQDAFLSNYTGVTLFNLGMEKPLGAIISNSSYRVSFYYSRYSSVNPVAFASYDYLYVGSPNGTMLWDSVPTPVDHGVWVKWSGTFTPHPADIGQPFRFGFSLTLVTQTSLAIDGPLEVIDLATGIDENVAPQIDLQVLSVLGYDHVLVRGSKELLQPAVYDALGRAVHVSAKRMAHGWELDVRPLPPGHYSVRDRDPRGAHGTGHFIVL